MIGSSSEGFWSFATFELCSFSMPGPSRLRLRLRLLPVPLVLMVAFIPFAPFAAFVSPLVGAVAFGFRAISIFLGTCTGSESLGSVLFESANKHVMIASGGSLF